MSRIRPLTCAVLPALLVAALVGCGGGDGHHLPTGQLTKAQYAGEVRELRAVAERGNRAVKDSSDELAQAEVVRDTVRSFADDLDALTPPAEAREAHDELVGAMRDLLKLVLEPMVDAVEREDANAFSEIAQGRNAQAVKARFDSVRRWFVAHGYDLGFKERDLP